MSTLYLGLKLGSTNTCIYKSGNGIVLKEPSLIAMPVNPRIKEPVAVGQEAKKLIGRKDTNTAIISPICEGVIKYEELAVMMLKDFLNRVLPKKRVRLVVKAVVTTPLGLSADEKKKLEVVCYKAGISDVFLVPDVLCLALGSGIDIAGDSCQMVVNIGGDTTNIAIISHMTVINGISLSVGGNIINVAINKYIEDSYNFAIPFEEAERIKFEICSLYADYSASKEFLGINRKTLDKERLTVTGKELYPIIKNYYGKIADSVNAIVKSASSEAVTDITKNGIYYYGEASLIVGLDKFMTAATGIRARVVEISKANLVGASELINNPQLLKRALKNN